MAGRKVFQPSGSGSGGVGGAPDDATYLTTTSSGGLSAEVVVGTTPGGELGGTWGTPTVDATHGGSSHAAAQSAAEATAASALSTHAGSGHLALGTAPSTQALGDSAAGGSATSAAKTDHKHGMFASGTTAANIGTTAGGSATTPSKSDHVHATGAGTPSTQAFGDSAATGSGPAAAMTDHKHAMPAQPVTTLAKNGATSLTGGVTLSAGTNIELTQSGHDISIAAPATFVIHFPFSQSGEVNVNTGGLRLWNDTGAPLIITKVRAGTKVDAPPVGSAILCDVNIDGDTIWDTQADRVSIADGENTGTQTAFDTDTIADGSYFTMDVDQVGSDTPGSDLTLQVWCSAS